MASGVQVPLTFEIFKIDPAKGDQLIRTETVTQEVAVKIDNEVKAIIDEAYKRATEILTKYMTQLTQIVGVLMEKETIDGTEIDQFFEAPKPRPRLVGPPFNEPALVAATAKSPAASPVEEGSERREPDAPPAGGMLRPQPA